MRTALAETMAPGRLRLRDMPRRIRRLHALLPSTASCVASGSAFADLLFGLPQQSAIQAGAYKTYLRANVFDWYAQDDWRARANLTLNYGLRYEYFAPYVEKYDRLVNLDHNADFTQVPPVQPGQTGEFSGSFPRSLVRPDRTMYSPRLGFAYRPTPKFFKETVVRGGYGINYNTGTVCDDCTAVGVPAAICDYADEPGDSACGYGDGRMYAAEYDACERVRLLDCAGAEQLCRESGLSAGTCAGVEH